MNESFKLNISIRFFAETALGWMSTKHGFSPVSELQMQTDGQSTSKLAFPRFPTGCGS